MNCDVMACFFAFMADLNIINPKFNISDVCVTTLCTDDITVRFEILDFDRTFDDLEYEIVNLVRLHCGIVDTYRYSPDKAIFEIKFSDKYIYYEITVLDNDDSKFYDMNKLSILRNTALQPFHYIRRHQDPEPLDFPNSK